MNDVAHRWPSHYKVLLLLCLAVFISYIDRTNISVGVIAMQTEFRWNEAQKGLVLSSFFVGYMALMLVAGTLANRYGGRVVLGLAVIWWSLFTLLTPPAAAMSMGMLIAARIGLGAGEAAVFPASINLIGRWVPQPHRSSAVALITSTSSISTMFALPITGYLARGYGWPMPFYLFGALGFAWAAFWFRNIGSGRADSPITSHAALTTKRPAIPWRRLLRLPSLWAIVVNNFCFSWSYYLLLAWLPSYFKHTFGVSIVNAGLLSAAPWLTSFVMANIAGWMADRLITAGRSVTFVRKLMQALGLGLGGIMLIQLTQAESVTSAVLLTCLATGTLAFCFAGYAPNSLDIAPRHADVIWGLSNTIATLPGIVGVYLTGWMVDRTGSFAVPLVVTASLGFAGALVFLAFASGERQIE